MSIRPSSKAPEATPPDPATRVAPPGPPPTAEGTAAASAPASTARDTRAADRDTTGPVVDRNAVRARQRAEFGGLDRGAIFFGWLVTIGVAALLTGIVSATGAAVGLTRNDINGTNTVSVGGGILLVLVALIAWYSGGYVAGRMARFDGARQGFGVWALSIVAAVVIALAGWILGDQYNVFDSLNLPRIPAHAGDLTTGGLIALGAILLGSLIAAVAGGGVGQRYHTRIDRFGFREQGE
jgi:hypothetical protein